MKTKFTRGRENKVYFVIVGIALFSFLFFFTSKLWLYDDSEVMQTSFGKKIQGLNQTVLVLNKWEYSPKKQLMEVSIQTQHTGADLISPTYSFKAQDAESSAYYPVNIVYKDENSVILQIQKVPQDYRNVYVTVQENRDKTLLTKDEDVSEIKPTSKIIVGDYRKVSINNNIFIKDKIDYEKDQVTYEKNRIKSEIEHIQNVQIPLQNKIIEVIKNDIASLKGDLKYQTDSEKQATLSNIEEKQNTINDATKQIQLYKDNLKELQDKYNKLSQKVNDIVSQKKQKEEHANKKVTKKDTSVEGNADDSNES